MRLVIEVDQSRHEVELASAVDAATVADVVLQSCGIVLAEDDQVWIDARRYTAGTQLRDVTLLEGSRIGRTPRERPRPVAGWTATLSGGLHAGVVVPIAAGRRVVVGRSRDADITLVSPSASRHHVVLELDGEGVRVTDSGSTNGTVVDGVRVVGGSVTVTRETVLLAGDASILLRPQLDESLAPAPGSLANLTQAGTAPYNRPPQPGRLPEPAPLRAPSRKEPPPPARFSMATILAPILMAAVTVAVMKNWQFALLALLSPVIGVGTWWEQRRRHRKETGQESERYEAALETLREQVVESARAETARRRDAAPDPATVMRRAALPTTKLWHRRATADDFLLLHAGVGDVPWAPRLDGGSQRIADEVHEIVDAVTLHSAPVRVDLSKAGVVGVVGDRDAALAVARSLLCQAAVHCGPADLTIGVFCDQPRAEEWAWTGWLPHVRRIGDGSGGQWVSSQRQRSESLLRSLRDNIDAHATRAVLLVVDSEVLTEGRDAPARALLGHGRPETGVFATKPSTQVSGIVLAATEEQLPASCTSVIRVEADASGHVTLHGDVARAQDLVVAGVTLETARDCATDLARFDDPELVAPGASLPSLVKLPSLLGFDSMSAASIRQSWAASRRITTPLGIGEAGTFEIDLVRDGPHGLVGGTTGSGKSEFLRSLVAGLAARNDPTRLSFILIDFKGGAAFAACERLPHTIGTVSNLDEQLADRALRALEAELRYRQRVFASAGEGVDNLDAYLATNPAEPMPRLLLVIDEFAMLAKDYPEVLKSLVSVAAVGRTLGVHMILATQRPAGVVNEDILANTNLRVALRVQSRDDSVNVVGVPAASSIGRTQWGRAYVKLGQDEISPVQTALVTGRSAASAEHLLDVHPVAFGVDGKAPAAAEVDEDAPTDLDLLIDAIVAANDELGLAPPRPVWPEPLGTQVGFEHARLAGSVVEVAVADDPDRQRQVPAGWDLDRGNLLLLGIPGSGTTTTLASLALTAAGHLSPDELDLLVLDMGSRELAPLESLPHTAAYVGSGAGAREQQIRLMKHLRDELDRRRAVPGPHRRMIVLVDGLAALRDEFDDFEGMRHLEGLYRVYADGPDVGIHLAVSTPRSKAVPAAIEEVTTQRWLFRLADPYDYSSSGVSPKQAPAAVPGRFVSAETKLQAHVAAPPGGLAAAVVRTAAAWSGFAAKPTVVGQLPESVTPAALGVTASLVGEPWRLPIGIRESDLTPAWLETYEGEHVLVAGPVRSGKSTLLLALVEEIRAAAAADGEPIAVWGLCGRRSPLVAADGLDRVVVGSDDVASLVASARIHRGRLVLVIDDAEQFEDNDGAIAGLLSGAVPGLLIIAAGRSEELRSLYSHWTKTLRKSRCGVLLQPSVDYDGDLLGAMIPRKAPVAVTPGRGYAVSGGEVHFVQCLSPDAS